MCFSVHGNKGQGIDLSQDQVGLYYNLQTFVATTCPRTVMALMCILAEPDRSQRLNDATRCALCAA